MSSTDPAAENVELRAQIATLELHLEEQRRMFRATLNAITDGVAITNQDGDVTHFNPTAQSLLATPETGKTKSEWSSTYGLFHTDGATPVAADELPLGRALRGEKPESRLMVLKHAKSPEGTWVEATARAIQKDDGSIVGGIVVFRDVTERRRWDKEVTEQLVREREKNEALERLRATVMELSTPILEVWDDVLALPVVGAIDEKRSAEMMARLLAAVEERGCRHVIIDITGVVAIDATTADRLVKLVSAVELLGARCILTGAGSAVAKTLVSMGANLGSLLTLRNLKHGLKECFRSLDHEEKRSQPRTLR